MLLHTSTDPGALVDDVAQFVTRLARESTDARGRFRIALAGGSTPKILYQRLATPEVRERIDWRMVEVFFGDERCVPADHPDSNYHMAARALLERVEALRVHRIRGEIEPETAAREYEARIAREPLDLVLLGMGEDGHIASLFPGSPALDELERWVVPAIGPKPPPERITLTLPAIHAARAAAFLVTGAAKAEMVARVMREVADGSAELPAARARPTRGELHWFVDEAAAPRR
jgi:6-phosphogluconolactonase